MCLGLFSLFPIPLSSHSDESISAQNWNELALTTSQLAQSSSYCVLRVDPNLGIISSSGSYGEGVNPPIRFSRRATGNFELEFLTYKDVNGRELYPDITGLICQIEGVSGKVVFNQERKNLYVIQIFDHNLFNLIDSNVFIKVQARNENIDKGFYGFSADREDSSDEESTSYVEIHYNSITAGIGNAFTNKIESNVSVRKLSLARQLAADTRIANRLGYNNLPLTADENLEYWANLLDVKVDFEKQSRHTIRKILAAKYAIVKGNDKLNLDQSLTRLLGDRFVRVIYRENNDLSLYVTPTFVGNIGVPEIRKLTANGAYTSARSFVSIQIKDLATLDELLKKELEEFLNSTLPVWNTYELVNDNSGNFFTLDVENQLDLAPLA